ncbi:hypothetical protein LIER_26982 [Lithospermum erythrorhizon]|uniref:Uncharacterized protein n=1 Tax=Lithospermum erythrorhizon TaxID=34254 RepID=A0AAV3RBY6_LITER
MKSKSRNRTKKREKTQMDFEPEKEAALLLIQLSCDSDSRATGSDGTSGGGGGGDDRRNGLKDMNEEIAKEESVGDNSGEICSRNSEETIIVRKKKKFKSIVDLYNQTKPLVVGKHRVRG